MSRRLRLRRGYRTVFIVIAVFAALALTGVVLAATIVVDSFNDGTEAMQADPTLPTVTQALSNAASLGGERDITVRWISGLGGVNVGVNRFGNGTYTFSADNAVMGISTIIWDGTPNDPNNLNFNLNANLLSSNPQNNAIRVRVPSNDSPANITITLFTTATNYSLFKAVTPGGIASGNPVDFVIPFSSFANVGSGVDLTQVGAIELTIDATLVEATDLSIDQFDVVSNLADFGDLPNNYGSAITTTHHLRPSGLRLGGKVDAEPDGQPNASAAGDDLISGLNVDDEDGVTRGSGSSGPKWTPGSTGSVDIVANGPNCSSTDPCYLRGWIDWNNNNVLEPSEVIVSSTLTSPQIGIAANYSFNVPGDLINPPACYGGMCFARLRLCGGVLGTRDCDTPDGISATGEVEDYGWGFGPLAVTLESLQAQPTTSPIVPVALVGVSALALIGVVFVVRRRKTA